jgi:hypothetical protein
VCSLRIRRAEKFPDRLLHTSTIGIAVISAETGCGEVKHRGLSFVCRYYLWRTMLQSHQKKCRRSDPAAFFVYHRFNHRRAGRSNGLFDGDQQSQT